jgi:hypothetical protein
MSDAAITSGLAVLDTAPARAIGVVAASEALAAVGPRSFLHSGPPLPDGPLVGPTRGAVLGALVLEGEAGDLDEAAGLLDAGEITLSSAHDNDAVGAMAGIISPSIPVLVVEGADGHRVHAPINEGLGKALRFGSNDAAVLERLRWLGQVAAPILDAALGAVGGIDLAALQAEGLRRGDECHNRNVASTAALIATLAPEIVRASPDRETSARLLEFLAGNPHTFLTFSMAAGKAIADAAHRAGRPGLVTAIAANGVQIGIRVSGLDDWQLAPAPRGRPKLFDGYTAADACPMLGDSFITETIGIGAFALVAAPAISSFIGASPAEAEQLVERMRTITLTESSRYLIPSHGYQGTPLGIDVDRVAARGTAPVVNNGFAHRDPGVGQVGAGVTELPLEPFLAAADQLSHRTAPA